VNINKLKIAQKTVTYLGHEIGGGMVKPTEAKMDSIKTISVPGNVKALRRFVGVINFYRKFIPHLSSVLTPLTNLLKKGRKYI